MFERVETCQKNACSVKSYAMSSVLISMRTLKIGMTMNYEAIMQKLDIFTTNIVYSKPQRLLTIIAIGN